MNRGKYVIFGMVVVGTAMALFAWWARYNASRRVLDRFGPAVATAVRNGQRVELLQLALPGGIADDETDPIPHTGSSELRSSNGDILARITARQDISAAAGLIHARHHLLHERGFQWEEDGELDSDRNDQSAAACWSQAIRFQGAETTATWLFDFQKQRAFIVECDTEIGIQPIAASLQTFLDQLPSQSRPQQDLLSTESL